MNVNLKEIRHFCFKKDEYITSREGPDQQRVEVGEGETNKICRFDDLSHFLLRICDSMFLSHFSNFFPFTFYPTFFFLITKLV